MASCSACGSTILFGGAKEGDPRFCNADCHAKGYVVMVARQLPRDVVAQKAASIFHGQCPRCEGAGPVDVHLSYRVWSALLMTSWQSRSQVSCRRCGLKAQIGDALFSFFLGWWGFPWGLVMTPVQVVRNISAMFSSKNADRPSPQLEQATSMLLATVWLESQQQA